MSFERNAGIFNGQIFDRIAKAVGAMPKIWGEYFPLMVENRAVSHSLHILENVYGFYDARQVFVRTINDDRMKEASKMAL